MVECSERVVGIITPWNGPFVMGMNPTCQALLAGNAVVLKPSEVTPFAGRLVKSVLEDAGLPPDLIQVVDGDGETGAALVEAGVDKISFTGSTRTGRKVGEICGRNLVQCSLELGGKDPMIVCADADIERAAGGAVFGAMFNTGQYCSSMERCYVVGSQGDRFTQLCVEKVQSLRMAADGHYDIAPMIWDRQIQVIERHIKDAVEKGAKVLVGGERDGQFFQPTVITDVTHDMLIMTEETFGPILPIMKVNSEEEASSQERHQRQRR